MDKIRKTRHLNHDVDGEKSCFVEAVNDNWDIQNVKHDLFTRWD